MHPESRGCRQNRHLRKHAPYQETNDSEKRKTQSYCGVGASMTAVSDSTSQSSGGCRLVARFASDFHQRRDWAEIAHPIGWESYRR